MFKRLVEAGTPVAITVDGKAISARTGDTVATALLLAGIGHCRTTPVSRVRVDATISLARRPSAEMSSSEARSSSSGGGD